MKVEKVLESLTKMNKVENFLEKLQKTSQKVGEILEGWLVRPWQDIIFTHQDHIK